MEEREMIEAIKALKKEKNGIIFAHNYQIPEIQEIADVVGDTLTLCQEALKTEEELILLSGVRFMAETIKILVPNKKILLPVLDAGCPMAETIQAEDLRLFKKEYPHIPILCYIKSSAEVKAESHICCTASNAESIVKSIDAEKLLFIPDQNLGAYIGTRIPEKEVISWEGFCTTHHRVRGLEVETARKNHPEGLIVVHPECPYPVLEKADFVGSTDQIIDYVAQSQGKTFIIGTEMGILHRLRKNNPNKKFHLLSPVLTCFDMKKTSLEDVYHGLLKEQHEIIVEEETRKRASKPLKEMLSRMGGQV